MGGGDAGGVGGGGEGGGGLGGGGEGGGVKGAGLRTVCVCGALSTCVIPGNSRVSLAAVALGIAAWSFSTAFRASPTASKATRTEIMAEAVRRRRRAAGKL